MTSALGSHCDGPGSTVLALADGAEEAIGATMQSGWRADFGTPSHVRILDIDQHGLRYYP